MSIRFEIDPVSAKRAASGFIASLERATLAEDPYRHWTLSEIFPSEIVAALRALPFPAPALNGISGARELHNNTRRYFDPANIAQYPVCAALAEAFHRPDVVSAVIRSTGAPVEDCFLRIEYAQDVDGFWLQPHTDLGIKKLTMLYYLDSDGDQDLGTDIYGADQSWSKRSGFDTNTALVFVPSKKTWHGFEPRPIRGVRKSVIINYVGQDWRDREQLAYPDRVVRAQ